MKFSMSKLCIRPRRSYLLVLNGLIVLLLLSVISYPFQALALSQQKLVIGYCEWGNYGGADKPDHGYYVDLVASVFRLSGYQIETRIYPWPRAVYLARKHEIDVLPGVWIDELQYPHLEFFKDAPLNYDLVSFFVTHSSPIPSGALSDLANIKIGYYASGAYGPKFFEEKSFIQWKTKTINQGIRMLFRERIDAFIGDIQTTETIIKNELPWFVGKYTVLEPPFITKVVTPAIDKEHPDRIEIMDRFTSTFKELKATKPKFFTDLAIKHNVTITTSPQ